MIELSFHTAKVRFQRWLASAIWWIAGGLWAGAVGGGMLLLLCYSESAGTEAKAPAQWPQESQIVSSSDRSTLVMFIHPQCPCSRASIGELDRLVARALDRFSVQVLFLKPEGMSQDWVKSDLWRQAAAIPGVTVSYDHDGEEAARFHAVTSGQTLLYDRDGSLVFQGGVTESRGHSGDSAGRAA
ncbi:MAG: hypothetical protein U0984_11535, partial [Prosthecobacter sp.]|nr:hypothetical protein [Prosthecobacter sp.]